eukprot:491282-Pleurochrysis_carterae.AAC.5
MAPRNDIAPASGEAPTAAEPGCHTTVPARLSSCGLTPVLSSRSGSRQTDVAGSTPREATASAAASDGPCDLQIPATQRTPIDVAAWASEGVVMRNEVE